MNRERVTALGAAFDYRDRGWCPVPVRFKSKAGAPGWRNFEPSDDELNRHFGNGPTNIGILLGERSGDLVDIDLDCPEARALARALLPDSDCAFGRRSAPRSHIFYTSTPLPRTQKFVDPSNSNGKPLVELRAAGHQTVAPGSTHPDGEKIEFESGGEPAFVEPDHLVNCVRKLSAAALLARHWPGPGRRHEASLALCGLLLRAGWSPTDVEQLVTSVARVAGDEEWRERAQDVSTTARRLAGNGTVKGGPSLAKAISEPVARKVAEWLGAESPTPRKETGAAGAVVTCASEVVPQRIEWLWDGRIARGKITVLDGDPGLGKSTVIVDIASRLTSGRPMPNSQEACEVGSVVIASCEDGMADTIVPRLNAAHADLSRIHFFSVIRDGKGGERLPAIPEDLPAFERVINETNAQLVIIDPLMGYLSSAADSWKDQSVRKALTPLACLAERSGAAIVVVRHLRKSEHESAVYAGGGSIAIIGQARTGLLVTAHPENVEDRILSVIKCNVAAKAPSLRFRFTAPGPDQPTLLAPKIEWLEEVQLSADELVQGARRRNRNGPRDEAVTFLKETLAERPMSANWVEEQAKERGISPATMGRAKTSLGVWSRRREWFATEGIKLGESNSPEDRWFWWIAPSNRQG